jgi:hypothetical protein
VAVNEVLSWLQELLFRSSHAMCQRDSADQPGRPAVLQVALPRTLLGLAVDGRQLGAADRALGAERAVVVRCAAPGSMVHYSVLSS